MSTLCSASQVAIVQLPNTRQLGAKHDERGNMAEATARAASIKRYGEALGDLALAEEWVQTSPAGVDDVDAWIEAGRRSAPAVEAVAAAPPRPALDKAPLPSVLDRADEERLAKAYAAKLLGCDAHDAPAWVRAAAAADDAGAAAACCASALPASEGSLGKEDVERLSKAYAAKILGEFVPVAPPPCELDKADVARLSKAYAAKIACDEPYPYAARGVDEDRAPYAYADDEAAEARDKCKILLLDACCDDDAAKERLREKGFALADDDDVEALERERCLRAFSGERSPAPAPVASGVPVAVAVGVEDT